jgi:hypothetical protein
MFCDGVMTEGLLYYQFLTKINVTCKKRNDKFPEERLKYDNKKKHLFIIYIIIPQLGPFLFL